MMSPFTKTTIVKPLYEKNNFGISPKGSDSYVFPLKKSKDYPGVYRKQTDVFKHLNEDKRKNVLKIDSTYSQLNAELEEIQKWKNVIELENKEKDKRVEELLQISNQQQKAFIDFQLKNENLNLQLAEEIQRRSFVSEKLHATKEMCSALKKNFNTLQSHLEYRNRIEDMIKAADNQKFAEVENLKDMFHKLQIEQSERVDYLSCALEDETNNNLHLRERYELQLQEVEKEREALCNMIRSYENEVESLKKMLAAESTKVQQLDQEKENTVKHYNAVLKEKEEKLKMIEVAKVEMEQQFQVESSRMGNMEEKYKELLEMHEKLSAEAENMISLKQINEQLKIQIMDLQNRLRDEEEKSREFVCSIRAVEDEKCDLELKIKELEMKVGDFENLQLNLQEAVESNTALLKENNELVMKLKDASSDLLDCQAEREQLSLTCKEKSERIDELHNEYEQKLMEEADKLSGFKCEYDQLLAELNLTKENFSENSKTVTKMQETMFEMEELKTALKKAEDELNSQKNATFDVLKLLQDTEAKYNKDRLAKESELQSYREQFQNLEFEIKMLKCELEQLENFKSENLKLIEDSSKLRLEICELQAFKEKKESLSKDERKDSLGAPDSFKPIHDEKLLNNKEKIDSKNKKWEIESSGSECLELVYDEKRNASIGLSKVAAKNDSRKNVCLPVSNGETKTLPFKTKRKRDGQGVSQEDVTRKRLGLPPKSNREEVSSLRSKSPNMQNKHGNVEFRSGKPPWNTKSDHEAAPATPSERKFFKKSVEGKEALKMSATRKPWF